MSFFVCAALMMLVAGAALALPLWRARVRETAGTMAANRAVHAARLMELESDLEMGRLSQGDYTAAQRDLEADVVSPGPAGETGRQIRSQPWTGVIALAAVVLLSAGLYWLYGNWRAGANGVAAASQQAVLDMVAQLDRRLHSPEGRDDLQGWDMLGHSYMVMGRYQDALDAFDHARRLSGDANPQELAGYAEALTLSDPNAFMSKAVPLFEKALRLDPSNVQALWYGGLGALQRGDKALAVKRWNAVLAQNPPVDYRTYIEKAITDAGGTPASTAMGTVIDVHITLSAKLKKTVTADETVFVYAEPKGGPGGPPLAVRRLRVADLPAELKLGDQDAVMPGRNLSSSGDVMVTARVSRSGTAIAAPGDLIGRVVWSKAVTKPVSITIDAVVK